MDLQKLGQPFTDFGRLSQPLPGGCPVPGVRNDVACPYIDTQSLYLANASGFVKNIKNSRRKLSLENFQKFSEIEFVIL